MSVLVTNFNSLGSPISPNINTRVESRQSWLTFVPHACVVPNNYYTIKKNTLGLATEFDEAVSPL